MKTYANSRAVSALFTTGLATFSKSMLVGVATLTLAACTKPDAPVPSLTAVFVTTVHNDSSGSVRTLSASLRPRIESEVAFRVGGKVATRFVEVGQTVRAGQVLAQLDAADYQLGVAAAAEQLKTAQVDADQAVSDAARFKRLSADGSVGSADLERQQARSDAAAARAQQARYQLDLARNRAGYAILTAPFDGVVTTLRLEAGQTVAEGQMVATVAKPNELELVADVPEALAPQLARLSASALLEVHTSESSLATAHSVALKLRELAPSAALATRTFRARYSIQPGKGEADLKDLRMGMTAQLQLASSGTASAAELPLAAVLATDKQPTVWLVDASTGVLQRKPVQVLSQTTSAVRVGGLTDGALVVSAGAQKLEAGMRVRPVARPLALLVSQRQG
ncbi:MAG: efflux transporter periplasmic adaptor subunit [Burkholderiales bacterium PBB4]|nr:MAG: efflux transporter periplasmic adaptor subunit [Burkholderiales bacterium PBB4]